MIGKILEFCTNCYSEERLGSQPTFNTSFVRRHGVDLCKSLVVLQPNSYKIKGNELKELPSYWRVEIAAKVSCVEVTQNSWGCFSWFSWLLCKGLLDVPFVKFLYSVKLVRFCICSFTSYRLCLTRNHYANLRNSQK